MRVFYRFLWLEVSSYAEYAMDFFFYQYLNMHFFQNPDIFRLLSNSSVLPDTSLLILTFADSGCNLQVYPLQAAGFETEGGEPGEALWRSGTPCVLRKANASKETPHWNSDRSLKRQ